MRAYLCKYPGCTHIVDTPRTYCKQHAALGRAAEMRKADARQPQCPGCNKYRGGEPMKFRSRLVADIGEERVKRLEAKAELNGERPSSKGMAD